MEVAQHPVVKGVCNKTEKSLSPLGGKRRRTSKKKDQGHCDLCRDWMGDRE